jgi:hypothetical protein
VLLCCCVGVDRLDDSSVSVDVVNTIEAMPADPMLQSPKKKWAELQLDCGAIFQTDFHFDMLEALEAPEFVKTPSRLVQKELFSFLCPSTPSSPAESEESPTRSHLRTDSSLSHDSSSP